MFHVSQVDDAGQRPKTPRKHVDQTVRRQPILGLGLRATIEQSELHNERTHIADNQRAVDEGVAVDQHCCWSGNWMRGCSKSCVPKLWVFKYNTDKECVTRFKFTRIIGTFDYSTRATSSSHPHSGQNNSAACRADKNSTNEIDIWSAESAAAAKIGQMNRTGWRRRCVQIQR